MYADAPFLFGACAMYQAGRMAGTNGATRKPMRFRMKYVFPRAVTDVPRLVDAEVAKLPSVLSLY